MASKVITQSSIDRTKEKSKPPPIDLTLASSSSNAGGKMSPSPHPLSARGDKEKKIGHRRVDEAGQVTYKKKPTSELMAAMQLGISRSIGSLCMKPERDLLMQDFTVVESVFFPSEGSNITPAHHYSDFRFKTYAPTAFRYFRLLFGIQPDDFLMSLCNEPLRELSNPGASGSVFYITNDDEFIIKTVQHKEAEFLQKLLPGYYMNLNQNPRTLLPKFYGLYTYQCGGKNIRFIIMNNLLPTNIRLHEKYDLKGSTHKRKASKGERAKRSPTLKDLDFKENHSEGVLLESETWAALCKTIQRDCRVLESFKIMDYSLLLGIHNLDQAAFEKRLAERESRDSHSSQQDTSLFNTSLEMASDKGLQRNKSVKQRLANYSTALESIQADSEPVEVDDENIPPGGIPARNTKGERLLLFVGIIDILQSYRLAKKLEHRIKAVVHDGDTISVHRPGFYAERYVKFFNESIFKKVPCSLKHSPSKKKATQRQRSVTQDSEVKLDRQRSREDDILAGPSGGGRPDLLPTTPDLPVTSGDDDESKNASTQVTDDKLNRSHTPELLRPMSYKSAVQERIYQEEASKSPNHSLSESTTAYTEEPSVSYTASSPSVSCESLERDTLSARAHGPSLEDLPEASSSQEHIDGTSDSHGSQTSVDNDNSIVSPEDVTLSDITLKPDVSCESVPSTVTLTPDNTGEVTRGYDSNKANHGASAEGTQTSDQVQN